MYALDVGVGFGYTSAAIRATHPSAEIVGIEHPSRSLLADPECRYLYDVPCIRTVGGDAYHLPVRPGLFDLVVCGEILEHLAPTRVLSFLREVARVMKPGGVLVLTTPNLLSLTNRGLMLLGQSPFELPVPSAGDTFGHIREYSKEDLTSLLSLSGFIRVETRVVSRTRGAEGAPLHVRAASLIERLVGVMAPNVNGFLVSIASRPTDPNP